MEKEMIVLEEKTSKLNEDTRLGIYLEVYKTQWADVHHTRDQDWEFSRLILAGFLGLSGLTVFTTSSTLITTLAVAFMIFSVLGILVTLRHKRLFDEKMRAIRILERSLNIDQLDLFPPNIKSRRMGIFKIPSTQKCLIVIYILSLLIFTMFLLVELRLIV